MLKGGLFIYSVTNFDSRVTVDVDFLLRKIPNTPEQLRTVIESIISMPTGNDFITFEIEGIAPIAVAKSTPVSEFLLWLELKIRKRRLVLILVLAMLSPPIASGCELWIRKLLLRRTSMYYFINLKGRPTGDPFF